MEKEKKNIVVAIYTDGFGTYQARCLNCKKRMSWRKKEITAAADSKKHRCI